MVVTHADEEYRCTKCKSDLTFHHVYNNCKNWKCDICESPISIKIKAKGNVYSCNRLNPDMIKEGNSYVLDFDSVHSVLKIYDEPNNYRIALKEYGIINASFDSFHLVINGGWFPM